MARRTKQTRRNKEGRRNKKARRIKKRQEEDNYRRTQDKNTEGHQNIGNYDDITGNNTQKQCTVPPTG